MNDFLHFNAINIGLFQIFSIAISGNIASYLQEASSEYKWKYNFNLVSAAATTIVVYVILIPISLWAAFKWTARPVDSDLITDEVSESVPFCTVRLIF